LFRSSNTLLLVLLVVAGEGLPAMAQSGAEGPTSETSETSETADRSETDEQTESRETGVLVEPAPSDSQPAVKRSLRWSATLLGRLTAVDSEDDSDDLGGFFDRYDYTADKGGALPVEIGLGDASLDLIEDGEALLQMRFRSPTSNLGFTDSRDWFLNQRGTVLGRLDGLQLDFNYHRFRTEKLRIFPNTGGSALPFTDLTREDDRFDRTRTGFVSELRWRPASHFGPQLGRLAGWAPELAFRGGFESREGTRQLRTSLDPGNDWTSLGQNLNSEVGRVGAGLRITPGGRFTLRLDMDHKRFRQKSSTIQTSDLPFSSNPGSVGFVPSSDRTTAKVRLDGRIGDRLDLRAGFQATLLKQPDRETPAQQTYGLQGPEIVTYVANAAARFRLTDKLTSRAWVKVAHRENDTSRGTALFNPTNGTQVDEFLQRSTRVDAGLEGSARVRRGLRVDLGAKLYVLDRELEFAEAGRGNLVILPAVALAEEESLAWEIYTKVRLRPLRRLMIRGELGYRDAPRTGYVVELDNYVHGELRASYDLPLALTFQRPIVVTGLVKGGGGQNRDFHVTSGLGPEPAGPRLDRKYDRSHWSTGLTVDASVREDLSLSGSLFFRRDEQTSDFVFSSLQRYFQDSIPITFRSPGDLELQTDELSLFLGAAYVVGPNTDLGVSYSYVHATSDYDQSDRSRALDLIDQNRQVEADIHGLDLSLRHRIREGLRMRIGYGYQRYDDGAPVPVSTGSRIDSFDRSANRHTVTLGLTIDSAFFEEG
jgi:hypothetical protein